MVQALELSDSEREMLIEMGNSFIPGVTYFDFDPDYGKGVLYIQCEEQRDKAETIHWFEFCYRYLTIYLNYSWSEVDADISSAEPPCSIIESFYRVYSKMKPKDNKFTISERIDRLVNEYIKEFGELDMGIIEGDHFKNFFNNHFSGEPIQFLRVTLIYTTGESSLVILYRDTGQKCKHEIRIK